jgi:hypothetical protein
VALKGRLAAEMGREGHSMTNTPKYLVDGLLSVTTHNGIHRLMFYELEGAESP